MTLPLTLPAGSSVVELRGGPYIERRNSVILQMNGSVSEPIFIRGVSNSAGERVMFSGVSDNSGRTDYKLQGQYYIIENIEFYYRINISFTRLSKYGTLRNSEIHNPLDIPIGEPQPINPTISASGEHTVLFNNEVHDNINYAQPKDVHGIQGSAGGYKVWVLNSKIYNNGGNGFQACHKCNTVESPTPRFIYIGGNEFYGDNEVAIGLKSVDDVVISENKIHGYLLPDSSAVKAGMNIGGTGTANRVLAIKNEIFNSARGIRVEEAVGVWLVGNVIYDIELMAINIEKNAPLGSPDIHIIGNTAINADVFINQSRRATPRLIVLNNIAANMVGGTNGRHMHIKPGGVYGRSVFDNNLFWQNGDDVVLNLGSGSQSSGTAFSSTNDFDSVFFGNNNIIADPRFADSLNNIYQLLDGSPAINSGAVSDVYTIFQDTYNIDIRQDRTGLARPQQGIWDRGAFEYTDSGLGLDKVFLNGFEGN